MKWLTFKLMMRYFGAVLKAFAYIQLIDFVIIDIITQIRHIEEEIEQFFIQIIKSSFI